MENSKNDLSAGSNNPEKTVNSSENGGKLRPLDLSRPEHSVKQGDNLSSIQAEGNLSREISEEKQLKENHELKSLSDNINREFEKIDEVVKKVAEWKNLKNKKLEDMKCKYDEFKEGYFCRDELLTVVSEASRIIQESKYAGKEYEDAKIIKDLFVDAVAYIQNIENIPFKELNESLASIEQAQKEIEKSFSKTKALEDSQLTQGGHISDSGASIERQQSSAFWTDILKRQSEANSLENRPTEKDAENRILQENIEKLNKKNNRIS